MWRKLACSATARPLPLSPLRYIFYERSLIVRHLACDFISKPGPGHNTKWNEAYAHASLSWLK